MSPEHRQPPLQAIAQIGEQLRSQQAELDRLSDLLQGQQQALNTLWRGYWDDDGVLVRSQGLKNIEEQLQWIVPVLRGNGKPGLLTRVEVLRDSIEDYARDFDDLKQVLAANGKETSWQDALDFIKLHPRVSLVLGLIAAIVGIIEPQVLTILLGN